MSGFYLTYSDNSEKLVGKNLKKGPRIRIYDVDIFEAIFLRRFDVIESMISNGDNLDAVSEQHGLTPVQIAIRFQNRKALDMMLDAGADILVVSAKGETSVQVAERYDVSDELFDYVLEVWMREHEKIATDDLEGRAEVVSLDKARRQKSPNGPK